MTAATAYYPRPGFPGRFLFLLAISILLYTTIHATVKHGIEAQKAIDCANQKGIFATYREPNGRLHRLCRDLSGQVFDIVTEIMNGVEEYISSFKPKNGEWDNIQFWLKQKNAANWKAAPPFDPHY